MSDDGQKKDGQKQQADDPVVNEPPVVQSDQVQEEIRLESEVQNAAEKQNRREIRAEQKEFWQANAPYIAQIGNLVLQTEERRGSSQSQSRAMRLAQVAEEEISRVSVVYERPLRYDAIADQLKQDHLVILQGPAHVGKRATAIYLACELFGSRLNLHQLSPEINLEQIGDDALTNGHVYMVDGLVASRADSFKEYTWRMLSSILKRKQSYLILCARPEIRFDAELPRTAIYALEAPQTEPAELLRNHLRHEGIAPSEIDRLLTDPEIAALVQRPVLPPETYELVLCLLPYFQEGVALKTALQSFRAYAATAVEEWFERCGDDMGARAFRIALAVFSGARYTAVQEAAASLAERISPPPVEDPEEKPPPPPSPFATKKSSQLDRANAYRTKIHIRTEYSDRSEVEVVKLRDENYQPAFLRYLWDEYPEFRPDLLAWLSEYGNHGWADMRGRAAAAVSFLAQLDFGTIRAKILYPWAEKAFTENDRRYRAALSDLFGALIWDDARANDVLGLLRHWMKQDNIALVWAAVRAYGRVGIRYPREAMEQWQQMLGVIFDNLQLSAALTLVYRPEEKRLFNLARLFDSMLDVIVTFFVSPLTWSLEQFQQVYEQILASLREWVDQDEKPEMANHIGLPLFLLLATLRMTPDEGGDNGWQEKYPPALLILADSYEPGERTVRDLAWLLGAGLQHRPTREDSLNSLQSWLLYVDLYDDSLKPALIHILQTLLQMSSFKRERWHGLLATRLRRWANLPRQPILLADELLDVLALRYLLT